MEVTNKIIEDELIKYFNPFAFIAVKSGNSDGGFNVEVVDEKGKKANKGCNLKFIIFDTKYEDDNKKIIWKKIIDVSKFDNLLNLKAGISGELEFSIRKNLQ